MERSGRTGLRGQVLAFVSGFACCALIARLMLVAPVNATSTEAAAAFRTAASTAELVDAVDDSVVSLEAFPVEPKKDGSGFWPRFFGGFDGSEEPTSVASGVILSDDGYIVTNYHVVEGAGRIRARLVDGREFEARVVGSDPESDIAVVRIRARHLRPARIGDSRRVRAGDPVVAIGNPLGFENSVSVGIVSANRRGPLRVDGRILGDMIQTDAAINQGNSGGGLFTADGRLIGINAAIMVPRGGSGNIGIGFAIPMHRVEPVAAALIARGRVPRPWLGIRYPLPSPGSLIRQVRDGAGVVIEEVVPGSPAAAAGLQPADILRRLGDIPIRAADDLQRFLEEYRPGQRVRARVVRGGKEQEVLLTLGERPVGPWTAP